MKRTKHMSLGVKLHDALCLLMQLADDWEAVGGDPSMPYNVRLQLQAIRDEISRSEELNEWAYGQTGWGKRK